MPYGNDSDSIITHIDWHIRALTESDHASWVPLWHQYLSYHGIWPEDAPAETWLRLMNPAEPMQAIGAFRGDRLEGIAHFIFHRHTWSRRDSCFLADVFISPEARRHGVARALVEEVYSRATLAGADHVYGTTLAGNEASQKLYDLIAMRLNLVVYRHDL